LGDQWRSPQHSPAVEQCVEGFKDKRFVLLFDRLIHLYPRESDLLGCFAAIYKIGCSRDERASSEETKNDNLSNFFGFSHAL